MVPWLGKSVFDDKVVVFDDKVDARSGKTSASVGMAQHLKI